MNRRLWIVAGGLAGVAAASVAFHARGESPTREPSYDGRPATFWIKGLGAGKAGADLRKALRAMGTQALR